jgi:hypothetical protein
MQVPWVTDLPNSTNCFRHRLPATTVRSSENLQKMAVGVFEIDAAAAVVPADFAEALPVGMAQYCVKKTLPIPFLPLASAAAISSSDSPPSISYRDVSPCVSSRGVDTLVFLHGDSIDVEVQCL